METSSANIANILNRIKTRDHETPVDITSQEIESNNDPKPIIEMNIINSSYENDESMTHLNVTN
jgi:hypothetical protein